MRLQLVRSEEKSEDRNNEHKDAKIYQNIQRTFDARARVRV